ncbi:MAG: hypothetical protein M1820_002936 [Bogoriella megaspora]|nr:MAG: hypothetical protein M1820_002936 [Bogoriella megaspora]
MAKKDSAIQKKGGRGRKPSEANEVKLVKSRAPRTSTKLSYKTLPVENNATVAADVLYAGDSLQASPLPKEEGYGHDLKFLSSSPYILKTVVAVMDGPYAGCTAVLLQPPNPFPFMKLPLELRDRIYKMLLLPDGQSLTINAKSNQRQPVTASGYSSKNRLALLAVDKQIRTECFSIVYGRTSFVADSSATLIKFLVMLNVNTRLHITDLTIKNYVKRDINTLFLLLADFKNLDRLHINHYPVNGGPVKVARAFHTDTFSWLGARASAAKAENWGDEEAYKKQVLKPLSFGNKCFNSGEEPYTKAEMAMFLEELKKKI